MPIITLEVLSDSSSEEFPTLVTDTGSQVDIPSQDASTGVHFLTESQEPETDYKDAENTEPPKARTDLLEYMMRGDGSVVCKLCGEILQSRTHWYRHKYKLHVIQPLNPSPLYQCEQCLVFFKSRKGYIGHIASRHSEVLSDTSPVLTNNQAEAITNERTDASDIEVKVEVDPELAIPTSSVPNYQTNRQGVKTSDAKKPCKSNKDSTDTNDDWQEKRSKEEKLVADIIDRVRRECEAQGSGGAARRGYTRRTTVMHT